MRWLLQNPRGRLQSALRRPRLVAGRLLHHLFGSDERFLASATGATAQSIRKFIDEPSGQRDFLAHLKSCEPLVRQSPDPIAYLYAKKVLIQYAVVRATRPRVIVETGVANGISSAYLLLACRLNGAGHLYSIDMDAGEFTPPSMPTGWVVPEDLRSAWTFLPGDSTVLLPALLQRLGQVDLFIHDSAHTYEHMAWEFQTAYPHIPSGGLLLSDDVGLNRAFDEFVLNCRPAFARAISGVGVMRK